MTEVLVLTDVSKVHPGGVTALDSVSLRVRRGEMLAVVGPSGSGKSTMLHVMGTLDRPSSGDVEVDGRRIADLPDRALCALRARRIGFVFQQFHLTEGVTAQENVATALLYAGLPPALRRTRALEALDRVGLGHRAHHHPHQLSGGERQRVAIARAIAGDPAIVLADEPTGALDTANGQGVVELLRDLNRDGATIAVITHDRDLAASLPRRVELRDGRIVADVRAAEQTVRLGVAR
ncbi:putative ABC transport system ATP-binding protein [Lentzea fradiae]|uniref:Putative ABC transport system ATP-binding protein n=1 Tax=Lentzea fradiae TaxID=200378 RepID=A0A1G7SFA4_9PSEU|nr:ABC transporter ATP-binding protein [Lentzea fradiae]SDG21594.1 putative ABC transport system ATP-binding protein [Lentzea fradiae]